MDPFRKNPFASTLAAATAILSLAALYFLYSAYYLFSAESDTYAANADKLVQLQTARPGPNQENLQAVKEELTQAQDVLQRLSAAIEKESVPLNAALTPQEFQDALAKQVNALISEAESAGVILPKEFALGFERYRAELPSPTAAPFLGQQLQSIGNAVSLLIRAKVKVIASVLRPPLPQEHQKTAAEDSDKGGEDLLADVKLAPFDILFEADQANFREALNLLVAAKPVVFVRLLEVTNSRKEPPPKQNTNSSAEASTVDGADTSRVPVVFGQESLIVAMRLAAVATDARVEKK